MLVNEDVDSSGGLRNMGTGRSGDIEVETKISASPRLRVTYTDLRGSIR